MYKQQKRISVPQQRGSLILRIVNVPLMHDYDNTYTFLHVRAISGRRIAQTSVFGARIAPYVRGSEKLTIAIARFLSRVKEGK